MRTRSTRWAQETLLLALLLLPRVATGQDTAQFTSKAPAPGDAAAATLAPTTAPAASPAAAPAATTTPTADKKSPGDKKPKAEKPFDLDLSATIYGAYDDNVFDKGKDTVGGAGSDVALAAQIGVPLGKRVSWIAGATYGTNWRNAVSGSVGSNALKIDASAKTGIEALLFGRSSLPGRAVKKPTLPALKLAVEVKYALTANPVFDQPKTAIDETSDSLEPPDEPMDTTDPDEGGGEGEGEGQGEGEGGAGQAPGQGGAEGGGEGAEGDGETATAASVPVGGQTFSNPNTHHKPSATVRLALDVTKKLSFGGETGIARDLVDLTDVEVSPEYNELSAGLNGKYKLSDKFLWLSAGYTFERRVYDEQTNPDGSPLQFNVNGGKLGVDIPLKPVKFKLGYDVRFKTVDTNAIANNTRHQVQLGVEVPIVKVLSAVADFRFTDTISNGPSPDSTRFIGLAGLKAHL